MIQRIVALVGSGLLLTIGLVHIAVTPLVFGPPSDSAAWFAGAGLALVFSAALNFLVRRQPVADRTTWWVQQVVNALTVWIAGFVVSQLPGPVSFSVLAGAVIQGASGVGRGPRHRQEMPAN